MDDQVFLNLSQTDGPEVAISVGTFLQRLAALEGGDSDARAARELLQRRGLTAERVQEARTLIDKLGRVVDAPPLADLDEHVAAMEQAEKALWAWYLEWSTIARTAIKDGRLLRQMGFGRRRALATANADGDTAGERESSPRPRPARAGLGLTIWSDAAA